MSKRELVPGLWESHFHGVRIYETNRKGPLFEAYFRGDKVAVAGSEFEIRKAILIYGIGRGWRFSEKDLELYGLAKKEGKDV